MEAGQEWTKVLSHERHRFQTLALSELLTRLLYETSPRDPVAFAGVSAFVFLLAFLAAALPAHRASRANPAVALRSE